MSRVLGMVDSSQPSHASVRVLCYTSFMPSQRRKSIPERQWQAAVEAYELGTKHGSQIARQLGVSAATVSREFKRRGCRKACRVAESVVGLEAALDAKDRALARRREAEMAAAAERSASIDRLIGGMMKSLIAAHRAGNLAAAGPLIDEVRRSLGK